jgi:hypothetical protein
VAPRWNERGRAGSSKTLLSVHMVRILVEKEGGMKKKQMRIRLEV